MKAKWIQAGIVLCGALLLPAALLAQGGIMAADPKNANKPDQVIDKIVEGRLAKFYEEFVLLDQPFIKDPATTVGELVKEKVARTGETITIRRFARYKMGEGLVKREDDFGDEVAKLAGS